MEQPETLFYAVDKADWRIATRANDCISELMDASRCFEVPFLVFNSCVVTSVWLCRWDLVVAARLAFSVSQEVEKTKITRLPTFRSLTKCTCDVDVLAGRVPKALWDGRLTYSNSPPTKAFFRHFVGYVQQDGKLAVG